MACFVFRPPPLHSILLLDSCSSSHILQYCRACRLGRCVDAVQLDSSTGAYKIAQQSRP